MKYDVAKKIIEQAILAATNISAKFNRRYFDYQKFIIFSLGRTGSSYLVSLLNSHPRIQCYSEVFHKNHAIFYELDNFRKSSNELLTLREKDPIDFLNQFIYRGHSKKMRAVGFKAVYVQMIDERFKQIPQYLKSLNNLKIIYLRRENSLKAFISLLMAKRTLVWRITKPSMQFDEPIRLNFKECLKAFKARQRHSDLLRAFFDPHETLELTYEDLTRDVAFETAQIQAFLGIKPIELSSPLLKQNIRSLQESILNYHELKDQFKDMPWAKYFDE